VYQQTGQGCLPHEARIEGVLPALERREEDGEEDARELLLDVEGDSTTCDVFFRHGLALLIDDGVVRAGFATQLFLDGRER
jgi:hypothetical protein